MLFFFAISIITLNILSGYFRIWLFRELFKRNIKISDIIMYGLLSTILSRFSIKSFNIQSLLAKASVEETAKIGSSIVAKQQNKLPSVASDYVAHAIICGVAFAIVENIIYVYYTRSTSDVASIGVARIISNTVVHSLFTGAIGYGAYQYAQNPKIYRLYWVVIGSLVGIIGHRAYNRSLISSHLAISIIFIIGGYYILAFLLYQSDRLFIDNQHKYHADGEM